MYIVASDYTNEKADVYKSVSIDKAFKSSFLNGMPEDEAARYEDAVKVDTESYADFCGCELNPYPEYVIGAAVGDGEDNHMYYMVFEVGE